MDTVARLPERERNELFTETAAAIGSTPAIVEKDFWVSWVLKKIHDDEVLAPLFMFKGGTSLSKVYGLIQRFSEDIDLVLDWRILSNEDPLAKRSKTAQEKYNQVLLATAENYIQKSILPGVENAMTGICAASLLEPRIIQLRYPAAFPNQYLLPEIKLEIGPLSAWDPWEERSISCYAAQEFPGVFTQTHCTVKVISAKRTFWDKATILHHEAGRPAESIQPKGYSRHYYDLAKLAESDVKRHALEDLPLLADVVRFKQQFYPRGWAQYELARPGSFRLLPEEHVMTAIQNDYKAMREMFFGEVPELKQIMATLRALEAVINRLSLPDTDYVSTYSKATPK